VAGKGTVVVKFVGDVRDLKGALGQVDGGLGRVEGRFSKLGKVAGAALAGVGVAVGVWAKKSFDAASSLEQSIGAVDSVFGTASDTVKRFAKDAAKSAGLSKAAYQTFAAVVGSQMQRAGQSQEESALSTDKLIKLGADLAATYGGPVSDAVTAISALLRGERDPIERYAVGINEATIKAWLAAKGLDNLTGSALEQAKMQATLALLFEQTAKAQGQYGREADTAAGRQATFQAQVVNLQASMGKGLLPVVVKMIDAMTRFGQWVGRNRAVIVPLVAVLGTFTAAFVAVIKVLQLAKVAAALFGVTLNISLGPIALVVAALAALGVALYLLWTRSETFRRIVTGAFNAVKGAAVAAFNWIKANWPKLVMILGGPFGVAAVAVLKHWRPMVGFFKKVLGGVAQAFASAFNIINGIMAFGKSMVDGLISAVQWLIDKVQAALGPLGKVADVAGKVGGAVGGAAKGVGGAVKGIFGATGGIVTRPTLATIGEAGPEAVIPLNRAPGAYPLPNGGGGVTVNVYAGAVGSEDFLARAVTTALQRQMARGFRPGLT
jgi:hypothetical protein